MAGPSITYTFVPGTDIDATEVNTNFSDIINGITDGTKDITVNAATITGLTATGVDADLSPTADATTNLGSTSKGWRSVYLDNGATDGGAVYFDGSNTSMLKAAADGSSLKAAGWTTVDVGDGTAADEELLVNADSGDAKISLQVNNASANKWTIFNDNSEDDSLRAAYNGTDRLILENAGGVKTDYFLPTSDDSSAPGANRLYKANVPKAWAHLDVGSGGAVVVDNDHNIASASYNGAIITINIDTNLSSADYAPVVTPHTTGLNVSAHMLANLAVGSFTSFKYDMELGVAESVAAGDDLSVIVMGDQ